MHETDPRLELIAATGVAAASGRLRDWLTQYLVSALGCTAISVVAETGPLAQWLANNDLRIWHCTDGLPLPDPVRAQVSDGVTCLAVARLSRSLLLVLEAQQGHAVVPWIEEYLRAVGPWLAAALASEETIGELRSRLDREVVYLQHERRVDRDLRSLTGDGAAMRAVRLAIQQVARTDSTVLITGETGTGKELVARAIHQLSARRERLLVAVNAAALAPNIVASELFGHEAGAFTGATRRRTGRFELAHQGTLFLDEIAEISPEVQILLLRVLQEHVIERVGGNESLPVDVRLIAATHQDLARAVADQRFRADLFYRLNVFPIHVPPLRERREDIADLVKHFIHQFNRRMNKQIVGIADPSLAALRAYHWPGNIRELENLVERAMIVEQGDCLRIDPAWLVSPAQKNPLPSRSLREQEKQSIENALKQCRGRIYGRHGAAELLGLKPTTLYGKMRKHGIAVDRAQGQDS